jgi:hypothetical protein
MFYRIDSLGVELKLPTYHTGLLQARVRVPFDALLDAVLFACETFNCFPASCAVDIITLLVFA